MPYSEMRVARHRKQWKQLELRPRTRGGKRDGAGRPRVPGSGVAHRRRVQFTRRVPVHVTVRVVPEVGRLRRMSVAPVLRQAFVAGASKEGFGICQFSIQRNHIHLVCEAESADQLSRGMQGWSIRVARRLNRKLGRAGKVFADRYHSVLLKTPRQVRHALCYVMQNARRHGEVLDARWAGIDPFSSAWYFEGWAEHSWRQQVLAPDGPPSVAEALTWLLTTGWKIHGLIGIRERPAAADRAPRRPGRARL
jgi:REP element-mobilizing transposase RayT